MEIPKILVTGGNGLVGSEFKNFIKVSSKDYDLISAEQTSKMIQLIKPTHIIHTAGYVGGLGANMNYLADFFYRNVLINTNLIHQSYQNNVSKVLSFLSTCIFPNNVDYPLNESKIHLGPPHESNFAYAYAKRMVDIQNQSYNNSFGTNFFSVIPTNIYGPNDNYNIKNGHVVPSLIHKVYIAKKENKNLEVWGSGKPLREFIFSKDVSKICENLILNYNGNSPVILSNSVEVSIEELVFTICDLMNFKNKIIWDKSKPDGQFRKPTDNSLLKSLIPNIEFTNLKDGLEETIHFFEKNYNSVRK